MWDQEEGYEVYQLKTKENTNSVIEFLNSLEDERKRNDTMRIVEMIKEETGFEPIMWGTSIVGFGKYHYKYASGHEGDMPLVGLSPRKTAITLYLYDLERKQKLLGQLGKHKIGKACLYIKKLEDVNMEILKQLVVDSVEFLKNTYPST